MLNTPKRNKLPHLTVINKLKGKTTTERKEKTGKSNVKTKKEREKGNRTNKKKSNKKYKKE